MYQSMFFLHGLFHESAAMSLYLVRNITCLVIIRVLYFKLISGIFRRFHSHLRRYATPAAIRVQTNLVKKK